MRVVDHSGKKFGRLTVIGKDGKSTSGHVKWLCRCECGNEVSYRGTMLTQNVVQSCGCYRAERGAAMLEKHGMHGHKSYGVWARMMTRCFNENCEDFPDYGGRGITVCERWKSVENFVADMGERPEGMSIDRINVEAGYEPGNCRWATAKTQANNRRNTIRVEYDGALWSIGEIAEATGIAYKRLHHLIQTKKLSAMDAVTRLRA